MGDDCSQGRNRQGGWAVSGKPAQGLSERGQGKREKKKKARKGGRKEGGKPVALPGSITVPGLSTRSDSDTQDYSSNY